MTMGKVSPSPKKTLEQAVLNSVSDPYQETLIWIRVPKKNRDKIAYKSTKIIKI